MTWLERSGYSELMNIAAGSLRSPLQEHIDTARHEDIYLPVHMSSLEELL